MPSKGGRAKAIDSEKLALTYMDLKESVILAGYSHEVDWQSSLNFEATTETDFLRESAWVVLSSGFRESVVRKHFKGISKAFLDWCSAEQINENRNHCQKQAISVFGNRRKIEAITKIVKKVANEGIECVKSNIRLYDVKYLQEFPFIGPVTSYHLAKNLGLHVVKPDRHLVRMAYITGHDSPMEMCSKVARIVGDTLGVVDLVFWRYATLNKNYEIVFGDIANEVGSRADPTGKS